ncbi:hypothetical protein VU05_04320 [Desulfobulbus sp. F1]|nr:hypothetical protein [Desulfobulbus sp. F1]
MTPARKKILLILVLVAVIDLFVAAGIFFWWKNSQSDLPHEKDIAELATQLVDLSSRVEGLMITQESEAEILRQTEKFAPYQLKVQYQHPYAVLLLCTPDGKQALLEDVGCSAKLDRKVRNEAPCEFTLRVKENCQVQGADMQ